MRLAVDTNVLVYAEGFGDADRWRIDAAESLTRRLPVGSTVIPVQVLGELHRVLVRKYHQSPAQARTICERWSRSYQVWPTSAGVFAAALRIAADHSVAIWDAVILSAAAEAGCTVLISEDVFINAPLAGVTIVNPFASDRHPLLTVALGTP